MQEVGKKWRALIDEFTGGDPAIAASLRNMYRGVTKFAEEQGVDQAMGEYIAKALA